MTRQIIHGYGAPTVTELEARVAILESSVRTLAEVVVEMAHEHEGAQAVEQAVRAADTARRLLRYG